MIDLSNTSGGRDESRADQVDVVVVGAGLGGIYAIHKLVGEGWAVKGYESAPDVGGVWYHNRYPGARVDVESIYYSYPDPELTREWKWTERYPAQPEILAYLRFVADRWDVRRHISFETRVTSVHWDGDQHGYRVAADDGSVVRARFVLMATGQLSEARRPDFANLDSFEGQWYLTSHWPLDAPDLAGKRVGVVGTGSSGVQVVTALADVATSVHVFQRTPNYSVPAQNVPLAPEVLAEHQARADGLKDLLWKRSNAMVIPGPEVSGHDLTQEEQLALLEERWAYGGHTMNLVFTDQNTDLEVNSVVSEFVRKKVRDQVVDAEVASALEPNAYPIGTRRLIVDTGYYQAFNRPSVSLVDLRREPIAEIVPAGVRTTQRTVELDVLIFALGFDAFTGALERIDIRNEEGETPTDGWARGPQTYLGLMTSGFPNLFLLTGPGSPSVLANMVMGNVHHVDLVAQLLAHMRERGHRRVEPAVDAEREWTEHVAEVASPLIRLTVENYMVHVNADGSRVFIPYAGGFDRYVRHCAEIVANDYRGFVFDGGGT